MKSDRVLTIGKSEIAYEIIDDEVIVINFSNGNYFSLVGTGVDIWELLAVGSTTSEIINALMHLYDIRYEDAEASVFQLCEALEKEGLIAEGLHQGDRSLDDIIMEMSACRDVTGEYTEPIFQKYTDMQDLVMIDPIHEVDDAGWPVTADSDKKSD